MREISMQSIASGWCYRSLENKNDIVDGMGVSESRQQSKIGRHLVHIRISCLSVWCHYSISHDPSHHSWIEHQWCRCWMKERQSIMGQDWSGDPCWVALMSLFRWLPRAPYVLLEHRTQVHDAASLSIELLYTHGICDRVIGSNMFFGWIVCLHHVHRISARWLTGWIL